MRNIIFILCLLGVFRVAAEEFIVFEKDGYFGVKDQTGNVTVPAVYETLGWSDGSVKVHNGVIGFKRNKLWGLITVQNKALTPYQFYTLIPIDNGFYKASIKGKFSNYLFHGVLDDKGKTIISFNYFSIAQYGINWIVSKFEGGNENFGVVSFANEILIPLNYKEITQKNGLYQAKCFNLKIDLYASNGKKLGVSLDSISYNKGFEIFRDGYAGYLDEQGSVIYDFKYKKISEVRGQIDPQVFPQWSVYKGDLLLLKKECDSLDMDNDGLLIAYLNGATHLVFTDQISFDQYDSRIRNFRNNQLVIKNNMTDLWSLISTNGRKIVHDYDSIFVVDEKNYAIKRDGLYDVVDQNGKKLNRKSFSELKEGIGGQYLGKRNGYWGLIDDQYKIINSIKYDSILVGSRNYFVSYLNRWGVMNSKGEWILRPEFSEVFSFSEVLIGRKGAGYSIYHNGNLVSKTTNRPIRQMNSLILVEGDVGLYGLYNKFGVMVVPSVYDRISAVQDKYVLEKDGQVQLVDVAGNILLPFKENYKEVKGFGEGYFLVKKEKRWGFIDNEGRLRISNRYDSAKVFQENRSAVLLRSKWGFIDKEEKLKIQPYFDEVSCFNNSLAIVKQGKRYGLIDLEGSERLELNWKSIRRLPTGNYLVTDFEDQVGLVDSSGRFILRSSYDDLEDIGSYILVSKNKKWGVLDFTGKPVFKINHQEIRAVEDLIFIKN